MNQKEIPDGAIEIVARHINERNNRPSKIPIITIDGESETPQYFEIIPFDQIDNSTARFFAIDGSYNSQEFYNGLSIGIYTAGYVCYHLGKQVRLNDLTDPVILGKGYYPENNLRCPIARCRSRKTRFFFLTFRVRILLKNPTRFVYINSTGKRCACCQCTSTASLLIL